MSKSRVVVRCSECGYLSPRWLGRCPECGQWNSMVEEVSYENAALQAEINSFEEPQIITAICTEDSYCYSTQIGELNRVLGGGAVPGAVILVGGEPGIGKSTLLMQLSYHTSITMGNVLFVSGEESAQQVRFRAERIGALSDNLFVLSDGNLVTIEERVKEINPVILVIDSVQTIFHPQIPAAPGSISQVRECTARLIALTKKRNMATFISGHVTKEGAIAGPKILEHMVDTVLYFEGERNQYFRILRAVKNRFGTTQEIGIFEMRREGLVEITNPSQLFMKERALDVAGNVVVPTMEGSRPILVELQALVAPSYLAMPRRLTSGVDCNRLSLILAILEKRLGISLERSDVFINIAGGVKAVEPGCDLAVALSVVSAYRNRPLPSDLVVFGEVGLAGEVRFVSQAERRLKEAAKLGFTRAIMPLVRGENIHLPEMEIVEVKNLEEALVYN